MKKQKSISQRLQKMSKSDLDIRIVRLKVEFELTKAIKQRERIYIFEVGPVNPASYNQFAKLFRELYYSFDEDGFRPFVSYPEKGSDDKFQMRFHLKKYLPEEYQWDDEYY